MPALRYPDSCKSVIEISYDVSFLSVDFDLPSKVGRDREIKGAVEMCQDLGTSFVDTIRMIAKKFGFTPEKSEAQGYRQ